MYSVTCCISINILVSPCLFLVLHKRVEKLIFILLDLRFWLICKGRNLRYNDKVVNSELRLFILYMGYCGIVLGNQGNVHCVL